MLEVVHRGQLRSRVTCERQWQIFGHEAIAVVDHGQLLGAATANLDPNARGTCIERVLDQFFGDGDWSFDDLAGRNLIDHGDR